MTEKLSKERPAPSARCTKVFRVTKEMTLATETRIDAVFERDPDVVVGVCFDGEKKQSVIITWPKEKRRR